MVGTDERMDEIMRKIVDGNKPTTSSNALKRPVLTLPVLDMTPERMEQMEKEGLIRRLCPGRHELTDTPAGETLGNRFMRARRDTAPTKSSL